MNSLEPLPSAWSAPRLLSRSEVRTLHALADCLVPLDAPDVPLGRVDLVARVEEFLHGENRLLVWGSRLQFRALEISPLFCGLGFRRFSRLPPEDRLACVDCWEGARRWQVRNAFAGMRALVLSHLYDDDDVAAAVGFTP